MKPGTRRHASTVAEKAAQRLAKRDFVGIDPGDALGLAAATLRSIARGRGGPNAWERFQAAQQVLASDVSVFTDDQLVFEMSRRTAVYRGCAGHCHCSRQGPSRVPPSAQR